MGGLRSRILPQPASSYHYGKAAESERYLVQRPIAGLPHHQHERGLDDVARRPRRWASPISYPSSALPFRSGWPRTRPYSSSPPSSNASPMSSAQSAAMHGLMVPPTVPPALRQRLSAEGGIFACITRLSRHQGGGRGRLACYEGFVLVRHTRPTPVPTFSCRLDRLGSHFGPASSSPTPPPAGSHASSFQFGQCSSKQARLRQLVRYTRYAESPCNVMPLHSCSNRLKARPAVRIAGEPPAYSFVIGISFRHDRKHTFSFGLPPTTLSALI